MLTGMAVFVKECGLQERTHVAIRRVDLPERGDDHPFELLSTASFSKGSDGSDERIFWQCLNSGGTVPADVN